MKAILHIFPLHHRYLWEPCIHCDCLILFILLVQFDWCFKGYTKVWDLLLDIVNRYEWVDTRLIHQQRSLSFQNSSHRHQLYHIVKPYQELDYLFLYISRVIWSLQGVSKAWWAYNLKVLELLQMLQHLRFQSNKLKEHQ